MTYYFVEVPKLPKEASHQMGTVEVIEYSTKEEERVEVGQTIVVVENWWARMALKAVGSGYVSKTFFSHGARVKIGDPLAIIICDPENAPYGNESCELEVIEYLREKPSK